MIGLSETERKEPLPSSPSTGYVYLLRSGGNYKIGETNNIERRIKEITIALADPVELIHCIRTSDPAGIDAYWHKRFAERCQRREWFKLSPADVREFKRHRTQ